MDTWTPPLIIGKSQHADDADLFARLGLTMSLPQTGTFWTLTRDEADNAPLKLMRDDKVFLSVDFASGKARHRSKESGKGAQFLSNALGVRQYVRANDQFPLIIDATGGLGQDAWALASIGCALIIIERHPVIHALLDDGLRRAMTHSDALGSECSDTAARVSLVQGDAVTQLHRLCRDSDPHAIYLDPMYPERRKKASSKKGMQFLHALLGPPAPKEQPDLLISALACNASRVVVKRPKEAPLLAGTDTFGGQRTEISTPNTRYDVYFP